MCCAKIHIILCTNTCIQHSTCPFPSYTPPSPPSHFKQYMEIQHMNIIEWSLAFTFINNKMLPAPKILYYTHFTKTLILAISIHVYIPCVLVFACICSTNFFPFFRKYWGYHIYWQHKLTSMDTHAHTHTHIHTHLGTISKEYQVYCPPSSCMKQSTVLVFVHVCIGLLL